MKINEIMTDNVLSIIKDYKFTEVCRLMQQLRIHHLPVVDEKGLWLVCSAPMTL